MWADRIEAVHLVAFTPQIDRPDRLIRFAVPGVGQIGHDWHLDWRAVGWERIDRCQRRSGSPDTSPRVFFCRHSGSRNVARPAANGTMPTNEPMTTAAMLASRFRRGATMGSRTGRAGTGGGDPPGGVALGLSDLAIELLSHRIT